MLPASLVVKAAQLVSPSLPFLRIPYHSSLFCAFIQFVKFLVCAFTLSWFHINLNISFFHIKLIRGFLEMQLVIIGNNKFLVWTFTLKLFHTKPLAAIFGKQSGLSESPCGHCGYDGGPCYLHSWSLSLSWTAPDPSTTPTQKYHPPVDQMSSS